MTYIVEFGDQDMSELKCEPDEYALTVREVKNSGLVKDHRYHLRTYKNTFVGQELVNWLEKKKNMSKLSYIAMAIVMFLPS